MNQSSVQDTETAACAVEFHASVAKAAGLLHAAAHSWLAVTRGDVIVGILDRGALLEHAPLEDPSRTEVGSILPVLPHLVWVEQAATPRGAAGR